MSLGFFPVLQTWGGVYQYSSLVADALEESAAARAAVAIVPPGSDLPPGMERWTGLELDALAPEPQRLTFIRSPQLRRRLRRVRRLVRPDVFDLDAVAARPDAAQLLRGREIDLNLFPYSTPLSFELGLPYVMAVHDLQHRLQPEFPEVSADGQWEYREHLFRNGARYASGILVDSEVGREDVLDAYRSYGLSDERVFVLPFVAPPGLRSEGDEESKSHVRQMYGLPERYLFYPAQFWPHKNHLRLVEALGLLAQRHVRVPVVLCGSWEGRLRTRTYETMMARARSLGVAEQLTVLGYAPQDHMAALYSAADGLVFPTFFGPTNLPVVEAWMLDVPVITSDIRGVREQAGDAAILVEPREPEAIAAAIERLWSDADLRRLLVERGRIRARRFSPDDFRRRLDEILERSRALGSPPPAVRTAA